MAVVDLRLAWQLAQGEIPQPLDIVRSHWLAKACEHSGTRYFLLSSDLVFAGHTARSLRESDPPDAHAEPGVQLLEAERRVLEAAPSSIVLRTGPLFASVDNNLLTRILGQLTSTRQASFDDRNTLCPVACADVARVVAAMLDQLSVGSESRGVFHYCAGDRTTAYGFAEAALAAASQYADNGDVVISAYEEDPQSVAQNRVLDCSQLRDAFAIKQEPWRRFINPVVRHYHEALASQR